MLSRRPRSRSEHDTAVLRLQRRQPKDRCPATGLRDSMVPPCEADAAGSLATGRKKKAVDRFSQNAKAPAGVRRKLTLPACLRDWFVNALFGLLLLFSVCVMALAPGCCLG